MEINKVSRISTIIMVSSLCLGIALLWLYIPNPAVPIAISLLPFAILFVINQTFWLVTLFVVFSFFRLHEAFPILFALKIPLLLSLGALSALLWHTLISRDLKVYWHHSLTFLTIFWVLVIIGIAFASNRGEALANFKSIYWKIIVMTLAIVWLVNTSQNLGRISLLITLSGMLIAMVAISNSINQIGLVEGTRVTIGRELGSMLGDPNDLALVLMFPLAFSISLTTTQGIHGFVRFIGLVATVLLIAAVIATQSRGGLLGALAVIGIYAFKLIRSKVLLLSIGAVGALVMYYAAGISDRASGGAAEAGIDASAMGRLYAWEAAFKMALDRPLTGVGLNNFYSNYFFYSPHWDGLNHAVHSTWFGVLAETGFLGLAVFILFIISLIVTARRTLKHLDHHQSVVAPNLIAAANAVYAGLMGTIVSGTFLTQGFNWPIYILAALTVAVSYIAQNDCQNEN
ncbi:O-antigen ligase family protein [Vibrio aestuarianus]|uniref:O-antigen ligase family protein n=1 Tax=Vibrio aestuarianus TaxID=28171 RepID=A0A7X6NAF6_9VIBR|nr:MULTISPECIES: O-antigen ligase family protein [Vibrio]KOE80762.1 membrane protein [Vibrio alginolyticus]MDE1249622.1 O-antigen ligase family protein [Vibrio aestuarianus]MDE1311040.1 O-antigen ligase family protein [Vibrio aestuarianus]MDE1349462.1 O-antigen ligase family protein [Vibrio aestuarianus]MDE1355729.1 O-antigen ligase family protein [Vibrio aestuarianus]